MKFSLIQTAECTVKRMNKTELITELSKQLSFPEERCNIINNILEENFFISKKNRNKIIDGLIKNLDISKAEAEHIYSVSVKTFNDEVKNKLKNPFKSI